MKRKRNKSKRIRLVSDKVDYRKDIEALRRIENYNPRLLEELRNNDKEKKKVH